MEAEGLFEVLRDVLGSIHIVALQVVFLKWMDWLKKYIQTNTKYTE
jgi:hypothetical protein